jgi:hypothetical protein
MKTKYFWLWFPILVLLILFLRRPDSILHAQFWAEDGRVWFANAYNLGGFKSLFLPQDGYFQTLSRLTALISLVFPITKAPLVFNFIALLVQALPALLIVSPRFKKFIPNFKIRFLLAIVYLLLPNTAEIHANITNAQWFLSISAFMVLIADVADTKSWKIFDVAILLLAGLSGPFSIFLFPVAFFYWYFKRTKQSLRNLILTTVSAALQIFGIFFLNHGGRLHILPQLTVRLVFAVIGRQVVWGSLIGANGYTWILNNISWYFLFFAVTTFLALVLAVYAFIKAPLEVKLFLLFGAFVFAASLVSPTGDFSKYSPLKLLSRSSDGARYWLVPMCAFLAAMFWNVIKANSRIIKICSTVLLITIIFGFIVDFEHPKFVDYNFSGQISMFQKLAKGQKMTFEINPPGWSMELAKR